MYDISVVIPAYNAEKYLRPCLDSIFGQKTSLKYEVIVVDNASVDTTTAILNEYKQNHDNLKVVRLEENVGCYGARRVGLREVDAKYLQYIDSDDYFEEGSFETLRLTLEKHGDLDAIIFQYSEFNNVTNEVFRVCSHFETPDVVVTGEEAFIKNSIPSMPWNRLLKMQVLRDNNIDFSKSMPDDVDFCFRHYPFLKSVVMLNKSLIKYRCIPTSTSRGVQAYVPYIEGFAEMIPRHLSYEKEFGSSAYWNKTFYRDFIDSHMYPAKYIKLNGRDEWLNEYLGKIDDAFHTIVTRGCKKDKYFNRLRLMYALRKPIVFALVQLLKLKKA